MKNFGLYFKRTFFFFAVNFLITGALIVAAQIAMQYFGIEVQGFTAIVIFYSLLGMGGSFIGLWMSKKTAIRAMGVQIIDEKHSSARDREMVQKVHHLARRAGLSVMPEVGIYNSPEVNAFATGPSKKNSLVAVSTGLLNHMNDTETEGVLAHEVAHIANGDMVTMTLIQGIVNTMVYLLAYILASLFTQTVMRGRRSWFMEMMIRQMFAALLFIPASMIVCFFSRWREFRADSGGAEFAGRAKMRSALQSLKNLTQNEAMAGLQTSKEQAQYNYLKINNLNSPSLLAKLFSTHPPIEERIRRLS